MFIPERMDDGRLAPAELGPRFGAAFLDLISLQGLLMLLGSIIPIFGNAVFAYIGGALEDNILGPGRSIGRKVTNTRLIHEDGSLPEHTTALKRNALNMAIHLGGVLLLCLPTFLDLYFILFGDGRRIADRVCDTVVVAYPGTEDYPQIR